MTFDPRPSEFFAAHSAPPRLQSNAQRERICATMGCNTLVCLHFDNAMARLSPAFFVKDLLVKGLAPAAVIVGEDFRFGHRRAAGVDELSSLLAPSSIPLHVVSEVRRGSEGASKIGSTAIRDALSAGRVEQATALLGRAYSVEGVVVRGDGRGRKLGFPTANLGEPKSMIPAPGVYAVRLRPNPKRSDSPDWPAVANIGNRPTFDETTRSDAPTLEVHVLDRAINTDLYDVEVEISFVARLRDEARFASQALLVAAITRDVLTARDILNTDATHGHSVETETQDRFND